jgi:hypothetical protein
MDYEYVQNMSNISIPYTILYFLQFYFQYFSYF